MINLIGNTPMIKLKNYGNDKINVYAKLEMFNPNGSMKDRVAKYLIENYIKNNDYTDKTIIEASSGNTGIGLAMICNHYKIPCLILVPETTAIQKIKLMQLFNAQVIILKGNTDNCIKMVKKLSSINKNLIWLNQYNNMLNVECHYNTTAKEIEDFMLKNVQNYKIAKNILVSGIGTGGVITGCAKKLKPKNWSIIGVIPQKGERIEGLRCLTTQEIPIIFNKRLINEIFEIKQNDAVKNMLELIKNENILAGLSSGANLFVAKKIIKKYENTREFINIIIICHDTTRNYIEVI